MDKTIHQRKRARRVALQALYQWQHTQQNLTDIETQFHEEHANAKAKVDWDYFAELLRGVAMRASEWDELIAPSLDRSLDELTPIEHAILRMACYELSERFDVPVKVVINEAVDIAKRFGAEQSHRYVNGVLDKIALQKREVEMQAMRKKS
ncbi:MAG: transcription antitermination factor NusB [Gammaproteobacteria bacterium]|nr:transcription antitermination factor NusB [Gammaproteobacteria bacterium]MDH5728959.1 transcription antitermination factor NusB [Gammaproteobacteria bacterium]